MDKRIKYATLPVDEIRVPRLNDGNYQRELVEADVRRIVANFNPLYLGVIQVAEIDGTYWVWDGQHRLVSCRRLGLETIPCQIAYGYSVEELADAFGEQGRIRHAVSAKDLFRSKLVAKSVRHQAAVELLAHEGYRLDMSRGGTNPDWVNCQGVIATTIAKDNGLALLATALRVFRQSWPDSTTFQGTTLTAMVRFLDTFQARATSPAGSKDYFERALVKALSGYPEAALIAKGRVVTVGVASNRVTQVFLAIKTVYNAGRRDHRLS
jgi:hypothetical protein